MGWTSGTGLWSVVCGTSHGILAHHMVQMGWNGQVQMGWNGQVELGGLWRVVCGTFHGIPAYHMVHIGWDGQVGLDSRVWCEGHPMESQHTTQYRLNGMDKWDWAKSGVWCVGPHMRSQYTGARLSYLSIPYYVVHWNPMGRPIRSQPSPTCPSHVVCWIPRDVPHTTLQSGPSHACPSHPVCTYFWNVLWDPSVLHASQAVSQRDIPDP